MYEVELCSHSARHLMTGRRSKQEAFVPGLLDASRGCLRVHRGAEAGCPFARHVMATLEGDIAQTEEAIYQESQAIGTIIGQSAVSVTWTKAGTRYSLEHFNRMGIKLVQLVKTFDQCVIHFTIAKTLNIHPDEIKGYRSLHQFEKTLRKIKTLAHLYRDREIRGFEAYQGSEEWETLRKHFGSPDRQYADHYKPKYFADKDEYTFI